MITENYIKMCEKAKEIQKACKNTAGDWFYSTKLNEFFINNQFDNDKGWIRYVELVWLPTQEQLQEMMKDSSLAWKHVAFDEFVRSKNGKWLTGEIEGFNSFNELWLVFVMKEKYDKVWNGKGWKNV